MRAADDWCLGVVDADDERVRTARRLQRLRASRESRDTFGYYTGGQEGTTVSVAFSVFF
ncbi:MAG TPA: hypothetical protein VGF24_17795 [Vicinamibacterales bacterium]